MNDPCPDDRALDAFVRGALAPDALDALDRHLDRCESCGELVASLASSHARPVAGANAATSRAFDRATLGRYELRAPLGEGASGAVFLAWDPSLQREVALKLLRPERAADPLARERLLREASALAALSHPNVVTVFDVGLEDETVYVAMEVVRGPNLREHFDSAKRAASEALSIVRAIGEGLAAAHARGLLHRDVKPENIIVGADRPRLVDFGLASSHTSAVDAPAPPLSSPLTLSGALLGTPLYMAPETLRGARATERSDLYSLAVTLYEALAGRRPFEASTIDALIAAIHRGPARLDAVDPALDRAVRSALHAEPERRPASVRAWLDALSRAAPRRATRRPLIAATAAVVSIAALVAARSRPAREALAVPAECAAPLAAITNPAREAQWSRMFSALDSTVGPIAARLLSAAVARFDREARESLARSCAATFTAHTQSTEAHAARALCLREARDELAASLSSFDQPTREGVRRASAFDDELPSLSSCSDARALLARAQPPIEPAKRAAIDRARRAIEASIAAVTAGHFSDAERRAREAVREATSAEWGPVEARAQRALSRALRAQGQFAEAERSARRAALVAEASRDDATAARAWLDVVRANGARGAWPETLRSIEQAEASVTRVGDPSLRAALELLRALAESNLGRLDEALAALGQSESILRSNGGDRSPVLTARANVLRQQGRLEAALALHREAMQLDRERLGDDHPTSATHLHNIAGVLRRLSRFDEARAHYLRALAIESQWNGALSLEAGLTQNSLGLLALESSQLDEATAWLERARAALRGQPDESLAELNLALVAIERSQFATAIDRATGALSRDRAIFGATHLRVARASKVLALALIGAQRNAEARAALAQARAALGASDDAESNAVRQECDALRRRLDSAERNAVRTPADRAPAPLEAPRPAPVRAPDAQRARDAGPGDAPRESLPARIDAGAANEAPRHRPAPSGSGSYGPAQRW